MPALPVRYISRSGWAARSPQVPPTMLRDTAVDTIVFHYTAADADEQANHEACAGRVRGIQRFHLDSRKWNDIAYNFLVCKHGFIFEGRGLDVKSAATGADNSHTVAVCFLGDDTAHRDDVTVKGRQALVEITRWLQGRRQSIRLYRGHRDFMPTTCPGDEIYKYVRGQVFAGQVAADEKAVLRRWVLAQIAAGAGWKAVKASRQWRRFRELGGR